jgi:NTE family protein
LKKTKTGIFGKAGNGLSMIFSKGLYESDIIESWVDNLLRKKGITQFKHVMSHGKSKFKLLRQI